MAIKVIRYKILVFLAEARRASKTGRAVAKKRKIIKKCKAGVKFRSSEILRQQKSPAAYSRTFIIYLFL